MWSEGAAVAGWGKQSKPRIWDEWYCYYTTDDEQQKLRWRETVHALPCSFPRRLLVCPSLSISRNCLHLFFFFFFHHVKPRHNSTLMWFPVVSWYAVRQQQWDGEKEKKKNNNRISLYKHHRCLVWWKSANPRSRGAGEASVTRLRRCARSCVTSKYLHRRRETSRCL